MLARETCDPNLPGLSTHPSTLPQTSGYFLPGANWPQGFRSGLRCWRQLECVWGDGGVASRGVSRQVSCRDKLFVLSPKLQACTLWLGSSHGPCPYPEHIVLPLYSSIRQACPFQEVPQSSTTIGHSSRQDICVRITPWSPYCQLHQEVKLVLSLPVSLVILLTLGVRKQGGRHMGMT